MSDEFQRGWVAATSAQATGHAIDSVYAAFGANKQRPNSSANAQAWEDEAHKQRDRAKAAEQSLAEETDYTERLEHDLEATRHHVHVLSGECARLEARITELEQGLSESVQLVSDSGNALEELNRTSQAAVHMLQEKVVVLTQRGDSWRACAETLQTENESLTEKCSLALQSAQSSSAVTAGFEAIYKMLLLEIHQKHDPSSFESLDPKKRMSVMDEAWAAFIQTDMIEYRPDLTFAYANPLEAIYIQVDENPSVEGTAKVDQEPEGQ